MGLGELGREIIQSVGSKYLGFKERLVLLVKKGVPLEVLEERMLHDLVGPVLGAESLLGVFLEQSVEERGELLPDGLGHFEGALADFEKEFVSVLVVEGGDADDHLVDDAAEGPPVHLLPVALFLDDLRGEVLGGAADGLGELVPHELGEAEVRELEIAVLADEDVLGLEVAVDDAVGVEVLECEEDLGGEETSLVLGESFFFPGGG